jgi:hypothetical protein
VSILCKLVCFDENLKKKCQKYHEDAHLFHGYTSLNTFWKINTIFPLFLVVRLPLGISAEVIKYQKIKLKKSKIANCFSISIAVSFLLSKISMLIII